MAIYSCFWGGVGEHVVHNPVAIEVVAGLLDEFVRVGGIIAVVDSSWCVLIGVLRTYLCGSAGPSEGRQVWAVRI